MHLYADAQGEYWVGNENGVMFICDELPGPGRYYEAEVWSFDAADEKYDLQLVQEAGG